MGAIEAEENAFSRVEVDAILFIGVRVILAKDAIMEDAMAAFGSKFT